MAAIWPPGSEVTLSHWDDVGADRRADDVALADALVALEDVHGDDLLVAGVGRRCRGRSSSAGDRFARELEASPLSCAEAPAAVRARATIGMGRSRMMFMGRQAPGAGLSDLRGDPKTFPESARQLRARADVELAVRVRQVDLDRLLGQEQRLRDLAVGHPLGRHPAPRASRSRSAGCGSRSGRAAGARRRRRARRARCAATAVAPHSRRRPRPRATVRAPPCAGRRAGAPRRARAARARLEPRRRRPQGAIVTDSSSGWMLRCASPAARSAIPSGRGSPKARARARSSADSACASSERSSVVSRRTASERHVECAGVRMPQARSISRLARRSARASSWRPVAARRRPRSWRVRPPRGRPSHPARCRGHPRAAPRLRHRPGEPDLDQHERTRADHEARVPRGVLGVGLGLGEVPAPPPGRRAQVRALDVGQERAVRAGPFEHAGELARRLDERAAEDQRERRDVDGGDARAGVVEQVERAQRELARLGGAAASSPRDRRGRRRTGARREWRCVTGAPKRKPDARASSAAARLPCEAAPRVACSSRPSSRSSSPRASIARDSAATASSGRFAELQRGAELGRDVRVVGGGDREVLGRRVVLRGLQLDRAELTVHAALVLGRRRLPQRPPQVARRDLRGAAPARAGRGLAQDPHRLLVTGGIALVAVDRDPFGVGTRRGEQLRGARVAAGAIAGRELRVDGLAHERVHEREPPATPPEGAAVRAWPAGRRARRGPPPRRPPPRARRGRRSPARRRPLPPPATASPDAAGPPPGATPPAFPPPATAGPDAAGPLSGAATSAGSARDSGSRPPPRRRPRGSPSPHRGRERGGGRGLGAVAQDHHGTGERGGGGRQPAQAGQRRPADGARGLTLDQRARWPPSGRRSPARAAARRAGTGCRRSPARRRR